TVKSRCKLAQLTCIIRFSRITPSTLIRALSSLPVRSSSATSLRSCLIYGHSSTHRRLQECGLGHGVGQQGRTRDADVRRALSPVHTQALAPAVVVALLHANPRVQRNRQHKRNRNASDIEVDRELEAQPEPSQAQKNKKASGEARKDRHDKNAWHAKKAQRHTAGAVVASEVVEARVVTQLEAWVEACSMRALLGSLLLGLAVRGWFTRVRVLPDGQEVFEEIPAELAVIPNLADRNMCLQLCLVWMAGIKPQQDLLSQVSNYTVSLERYLEYADTTLVTWPAMWAEMSKRRWSNTRFRLYRGKQRTVAKFWAETVKGARVRCNSAATGRPLALAYGVAGFSGSGSIGSKGVPVNQMRREACKQFPERVVLVHEFRTSRVSSARTNVVQGQAESFRWLYPVRSMAKRSRIRGLMCSTSNVIKRRFHDRDVSATLNIRRIAAGPGRPRELSSWLGRHA
ncbi:hypothetical protein QJQ45_022749, partial [Haematococcus lacustris]